jgi:hypothetical protein
MVRMWGGVGRTMPDSSVSSPEPSAGECCHQALLPPMLGRLAAGAALLAVLGMMPPAIAQSAKITPHEGATSRPHVYLMRGLLNIFSLGMDQLAARIQSPASMRASTTTRSRMMLSVGSCRNTAPAIAAPIF